MNIADRVKHLSPSQIRALADELISEASKRGFLAEFNAALMARRLREIANAPSTKGEP